MLSFIKRFLFNYDRPELTAEALEKGAYLVDVRSEEEFAGGSAPGAVNLPMHEIRNHLDALKKKKGIVVFCVSGSRSGAVKRMLKSAGIPEVYNGGSIQDILKIQNS